MRLWRALVSARPGDLDHLRQAIWCATYAPLMSQQPGVRGGASHRPVEIKVWIHLFQKKSHEIFCFERQTRAEIDLIVWVDGII